MGFWPKSVKARRRLTIFLIAAPLLLAAAGLSLYALKGTAIYFYTPAQMIEAQVKAGEVVRLGGLVKAGSVVKLSDGSVKFTVMDKLKEIDVAYKGDLPDLFREGQGVVCEGEVTAYGMSATQVLAKHDETYMPKNVKEELERQGEWRPDAKPPEPKAERPFGT
jgi:cytochrome c-type biogenesis protein CcmE